MGIEGSLDFLLLTWEHQRLTNNFGIDGSAVYCTYLRRTKGSNRGSESELVYRWKRSFGCY